MDSKRSGVVKRILKDHFDGFWKLNAHRFPKTLQGDIEETVLKSLRCSSSDLGYAKYECLGCEGNPAPVFVCFTCKSRFCHKCGKKYTDDWSDKQQDMIFNVPHRHMVFTIPKELRDVFFKDRKKLTELSKQVAEVFRYHYEKRNKKKRFQVGVITVIHTFGRDLKFNPHIHALVTEGALDQNNEWVSSDFIPYEYLRKSWQKVVLDLMKKWFPNHVEVRRMIDYLYANYPKGFYVNAEKKMKDAKGAAKYIGRYLARPAIAEYRIVEYDGRTVHFWYEDHQTGKRVDKKISVYEFIYSIVQHITPKHFRMVGRFGLYSRRSYQKANTVLSLYAFMRKKQLSFVLERKKKRKTYRQRMMESFDRDPFKCPCCHRQMELVEIWHADYGFLYHYMEDMEIIKNWREYHYGQKGRAG